MLLPCTAPPAFDDLLKLREELQAQVARYNALADTLRQGSASVVFAVSNDMVSIDTPSGEQLSLFPPAVSHTSLAELDLLDRCATVEESPCL